MNFTTAPKKQKIPANIIIFYNKVNGASIMRSKFPIRAHTTPQRFFRKVYSDLSKQPQHIAYQCVIYQNTCF